MNEFKFLVKATLSNGFISTKSIKNKKFRKPRPIIQILSGLFIALIFSTNFAFTILTAKQEGADLPLLERAVQISLTFATLYGFFMALAFNSSVYFDKNLNALKVLPISGFKIFLSKLFVNAFLVFSYGGILIFGLLLSTCIVFNLSFFSYIMAFLVTLAICLTISFLSFIITCLISRIIDLDKSKFFNSIFTFFTSLIAAISLVCINLFSIRFYNSGDYLLQLASNLNTVYNNTIFINWAGLISSKSFLLLDSTYYIYWIYGFLGLLISFILCLLVANKLYLKDFHSKFNSKERKNHKNNNDKKINYKFIGIKRELSLYKSDYNVVISSFITSIALPIITSVYLYVGFPKDANAFGPIAKPLYFYMFLASLFVPFISYISLSLEKNNIYLLKSLPLDKKKFFNNKISIGTIFSFLFTLVVFLCYSFAKDVSIVEKIFMLILGLFYSQFINLMGFLLGIVFVNYDYSFSNELQKGWGPFLISFLSILSGGLMLAIVIPYAIYNEEFLYLGLLFTTLIFIFLDIVLYYKCRNLLKRELEKDI